MDFLSSIRKAFATALLVAGAIVALTASLQAQAPGTPQLISPEDLARVLQTPTSQKPLILNVGPRLLYMQAHLPGAEYIGAGSSTEGQQALRERVKSLSRKKFIVIYCGCCPWTHCPNVSPAYKILHDMGFTNAKVLYIANNLGADWVYKGYPVERGDAPHSEKK